MIPAVLVKTEQNNSSTYTFWLKPEQPIDYTAGQFIELFIPHDADDRGTHRWFTLSSSPSEEYIAITTRKAARMSTFKQRLFNIKVGDSLQISQAMGDFVLPMQRSIPLLFVVRGIGITPVRSMTKSLIDAAPNIRDISIIHSVKNHDDLLFQDIYKVIASGVRQEIDNSAENTDAITKLVLAYYAKNPNSRIYISGPEKFAEELYASLISADIKPSSLITDYFHGYNA